ncbi:hypothetical protein HK103_003448 [Boothiomyces macroporosus]|uniref:Uracil catabolism protein 4 n=1 Tax=Boothiomyces macroporosus TaxID=261099 RepID=A0AAD5UHY6_9FUNG|nr:hypothetical protein HK103_003448 [Boothiomyces macroporosus]
MQSTIEHIKSLDSIRLRTNLVFSHPECLQNFDIDLSKLPAVADLVVELIKRDYKSPAEIPPHSRWRHFEASPVFNKTIDRIGDLIKSWKTAGIDHLEIVRRLLDLFVTSVLLDAGAGAKWKYTNSSGTYNRSEGLGIASLDLFLEGALSSSSNPFQCDSKGLENITVEKLSKVFQVSEENPLVGLEGRCNLLQRLGSTLLNYPEFFSRDSVSRPGNLVDYLINHPTTKTVDGTHQVQIECLWHVVVVGFSGVWPDTRTKLGDTSLGDVWHCKALEAVSKLPSKPLGQWPGSESLVTFHKLSQWLTYSLMEPLLLANIKFIGVEKMTGLPEYRNGGLFVDMGVLTLKKSILSSVPAGTIPKFQVWDDAIVEWRALTIPLLDKTAELVRQRLNMTAEQLPLAKVLEAGTWKAGREVAAKLRKDKGPPIEIISDGTVF